MAEEASFGVARLRQAITNQATCGNGQFELSIDSADKLCRECEDELAQLAWAKDVPVPKDADGNAVPLTTKVMYFGDSPRDVIGFHYNADNGWELYTTTLYTRLSTFNIHRPDSWEKLETDVEQFEDGGTACEYFGSELASCNECKSPCSAGADCRNSVARDVLRRAKALAERDAKEADRD